VRRSERTPMRARPPRPLRSSPVRATTKESQRRAQPSAFLLRRYPQAGTRRAGGAVPGMVGPVAAGRRLPRRFWIGPTLWERSPGRDRFWSRAGPVSVRRREAAPTRWLAAPRFSSLAPCFSGSLFRSPALARVCRPC
jgi:hypothetical protein